jgi:hypothetical protein
MLEKGRRDAKTAMIVAQRGGKLCGLPTRQALKTATPTAPWHGGLMKQISGPQHSHFHRYRHNFADPAVDWAGWEVAAVSAELLPFHLD